jgi:type I restriction enzyme M protein
LEDIKMADENSRDLISVLWSGADILRSKMDANEYKDYLLGIVFYKYLSDSFLIKVYDLIYDEKPETLKVALEAYKEALEDESAEELKEQIKSECHYVIEPELTYTYFADMARNNCFNREQLQKAFNNIEQSDPLFADLFTDIDLYSNRLGAGDQKQSDTISSLIKEIDSADLLNSDADVLGNAYEYLIGQFASETGKKAGEFYTPQAVSKILTKIAITGQETKRGLSVYDPCMGSGSLLLNAKKYSREPRYIRYFGQELMTSTYNLARMNMFLHGIVPENQKLRNADTLDSDWPTGEETEFDMVLMNPPYSAKWGAQAGFLQDERFSDYGVLAPKSKADYAFLLHGLYHLKNGGTMAIVLPHGVLFRGAAEGKIREKLLRSGNIYAVIGLPANLFYNTSIPTCIIVLKKHRDGRDVLFIDASQKFEKGKKQNAMTDEHIDSVIELYNKRETVDKESHLASFEEIENNDFNLNIPRYVDNFEKEEEINLGDLLNDMKKTDDEIGQVQGELATMLGDLTSSDEDILELLKGYIDMIKG